MVVQLAAVAAVIVGLTGCYSGGVFECVQDSQCDRPAQGVCEPTGFCSFPDDVCSGGRRYNEVSGGGLAGQCVGAVTPAPDADLTAPDADPLAPDAMVMPDAPAGSISLIRPIQGVNDDAEEVLMTGNINLLSFDLDLVLDVNKDLIVGLRFNTISIPQGATIVSSTIQFTVDETDSGATALQFFAEDIDDAAVFTSTSGSISARTKTTASVSWSPVPWSRVGEAGVDQRTPDLASVVQQITNRAGWQSGNSLVFLITGTGQRTAESFDGEPQSAPVLSILYLAP